MISMSESLFCHKTSNDLFISCTLSNVSGTGSWPAELHFETVSLSQYFILHTNFVVDGLRSTGKMSSPTIRFIRVDFPALVSPRQKKSLS